MLILLNFILLFCFYAAGIWTQGLTHANRCSATWVKLLALFCFRYFSDKITHFFLGPVWDRDSHTYASWVAGIIGWDGEVLLTFCPMVPQTMILLPLPLSCWHYRPVLTGCALHLTVIQTFILLIWWSHHKHFSRIGKKNVKVHFSFKKSV
jgi:hypothetical protein